MLAVALQPTPLTYLALFRSSLCSSGGIARPNLLKEGMGAAPNHIIVGPLSGDVNSGGYSDVIEARNGRPDVIDCGPGTDAVQVDAGGIDTLANCEIVDAPAVTPQPPAKTGKRAAAVKRCITKYKPHTKARRKCLRRAHKLPV